MGVSGIGLTPPLLIPGAAQKIKEAARHLPDNRLQIRFNDQSPR